MIRIKHVLKDGTQLDDVSGHVVKLEENEALYHLILGMERKEEKNEESNPVGL